MARLRYFASLRERVGLSEEDIDLPGDVALGRDLVAFLARRHAHARDALLAPSVRIAIDQRVASPETGLAGAREIALFPPMTGG